MEISTSIALIASGNNGIIFVTICIESGGGVVGAGCGFGGYINHTVDLGFGIIFCIPLKNDSHSWSRDIFKIIHLR